MDLNWTTFLLEILNFLVLVWLLKRFLYKPVLGAIAQRKAGIEQMVADARRLRTDAEILRTQYENRLVGWDRERQAAHEKLLDEIGAERIRLMAEVQTSLKQEREKAAALEQRRMAELSRRVQTEALTQATQFASRLLSRLAGRDLESRIIDMVAADLPGLPVDERRALRSALSSPETRVKVTSAYPLQTDRRELLTRALGLLADRPVTCAFGEDPALLSGLQLSAGAWMLRASLQDELKFFAEAAQNVQTNHA